MKEIMNRFGEVFKKKVALKTKITQPYDLLDTNMQECIKSNQPQNKFLIIKNFGISLRHFNWYFLNYIFHHFPQNKRSLMDDLPGETGLH